MAEDKGKKGRLLFLERYLYENADEDHPVTREQIQKAYEKYGYTVSKNTFTDDFKTLQEEGVVISKKPNSKPEAYYIERTFDKAEIRALIDAVSFAQFFTVKKSDQLIRKISKLAAKPSRRSLTANVYAMGRRKTGNSSVNTAINTILTAIRDKRQVSFLYTDYNENKKITYRNGQQRYKVSPYALILDNNRYYVPAYNPARDKVVNFRIDRMRSVIEEEDAAEKKADFDFEEYTRYSIGMYSGDGPERNVALESEKWHMTSIVDFFGEDVETVYDKNTEKIKAYVKVKPGRTFYSWVMGFAGEMAILGPEDVKQEYEKMLSDLLKAQGNREIG